MGIDFPTIVMALSGLGLAILVPWLAMHAPADMKGMTLVPSTANQAWRAIAAERRWTLGSEWFRQTMSGAVGPLPAHLEHVQIPNQQPLLRLRVGGLPTGAVIQRENLATRAMSALGRADFQLGHPKFDQHMRLSGRIDVLRAILDEPTRRAWLGMDVSASLDDQGVLTAEFPWSHSQSRAQIDSVLHLAQLLHSGGRSIERRLARIAEEDSKSLVRVGALQMLAKRAPQRGRALAAELRKSRDPRVVAAAAPLTHDDELAVHMIPQDALPPEERVRLLDWIKESAGDRAEEAVVAALGTQEPALQQRALELIAELHLLRLGGGAAQELVLPCLRTRDADVQAAAAMALGVVGNTSAVEPLQELGQSRAGARAAVHAAVSAIQARAGELPQGALSFAEPAPGAGSLSSAAPSRAGALSRARPLKH